MTATLSTPRSDVTGTTVSQGVLPGLGGLIRKEFTEWRRSRRIWVVFLISALFMTLTALNTWLQSVLPEEALEGAAAPVVDPLTIVVQSVSGQIFVVAAIFAVSGVLHLVRPSAFEALIPPFLPAPGPIIALSGIAELVCAAGLLRRAGWAAPASAALLVAVFPGNIWFAIATSGDPTAPPALVAASWLRLPIQAPLIWAALQARDARPRSSPPCWRRIWPAAVDCHEASDRSAAASACSRMSVSRPDSTATVTRSACCGLPLTALTTRSRSQPTRVSSDLSSSPVPTNSCQRASTSPRSSVPSAEASETEATAWS